MQLMSESIFDTFNINDSPTRTHWYATTGHNSKNLSLKKETQKRPILLARPGLEDLNVAQASDCPMFRCTEPYIPFSECASTDIKWKVITSYKNNKLIALSKEAIDLKNLFICNNNKLLFCYSHCYSSVRRVRLPWIKYEL